MICPRPFLFASVFSEAADIQNMASLRIFFRKNAPGLCYTQNMITYERFEEITYELAGLLPEVFFRNLDGGVMAREQVKLHPQAVADDLFILGEYHVTPHLGRFVVLYYGSFCAVFGAEDEEMIRREMWHVLRHEFLHHLESMAGERDLEISDAVQIAGYRRSKGL